MLSVFILAREAALGVELREHLISRHANACRFSASMSLFWPSVSYWMFDVVTRPNEGYLRHR